jgi:hypothetical protein
MEEVGEPLVVRTRAAFEDWLTDHHATAMDVWLVSYRRTVRARSLSHPAACEEALCFGWGAGETATLDRDSYVTRFAPRRPGVPWSDLDMARARRLGLDGRLRAEALLVLPSGVRRDMQSWANIEAECAGQPLRPRMGVGRLATQSAVGRRLRTNAS